MAETTEKFTINLGVVDLGKIDLLVEQGFYANRTDFVKDAIRRGLDSHDETVRRAVSRLEDEAEQQTALANAAEQERTRGLIVDTGERTRVVSRTVIGILAYGRQDLLRFSAAGQKVRLTCVGLIVLLDDVTPELVDKVIDSVRSYGSIRASAPVREILKGKMR